MVRAYMVRSQNQKSMTYGYPYWLSLNDTTGLTLPTPDFWFVLFIRTCKTQQLWETSFNGYTDMLIAGTYYRNGCTWLITRTINKQQWQKAYGLVSSLVSHAALSNTNLQSLSYLRTVHITIAEDCSKELTHGGPQNYLCKSPKIKKIFFFLLEPTYWSYLL